MCCASVSRAGTASFTLSPSPGPPLTAAPSCGSHDRPASALPCWLQPRGRTDCNVSSSNHSNSSSCAIRAAGFPFNAESCEPQTRQCRAAAATAYIAAMVPAEAVQPGGPGPVRLAPWYHGVTGWPVRAVAADQAQAAEVRAGMGTAGRQRERCIPVHLRHMSASDLSWVYGCRPRGMPDQPYTLTLAYAVSIANVN